jgi:hypothetical protein
MRSLRMIRLALCVSALSLAASPAAGQARQQPVPTAPAGLTTLQGFSVVLVLGGLSDGGEPFAADVPRGAARALKDMADFLPYRSYRLLDSAWILTTGAGRVTNRVKGVDNHIYEATVESSATAAPRMNVKFALRDTGAATAATAERERAAANADADLLSLVETARLTQEVAGLEGEVAQLQQKLDVTHPDVARKRVEINEKKRRLELLTMRQKSRKTADWLTASRLIDTSFTMDVGETVVVGTSRLQGDAALIVLLTAVPRVTK